MNNYFSFESFYLAFRIWTIVSFLLGLLGIGIFLYYRTRQGSTKRTVGILFFGQMWLSVILLMLFNNIFRVKARSELFNKLELADGKIKLCDKELSEKLTKDYKNLLLEIREIGRHHSSPTYCGFINFESCGEAIKLRVERDNNIKTEYWIYWDKYIITKDNPIGYLRTEKLNEMNCR